MTDIYSGWTKVQAVQNKAQVWVFAALKELRARLPFSLHGIDSDNGSGFINADLLQYCQQERLTFTRSRPYRLNPAELKRQIERLQEQLLQLAAANRPQRLYRRPEST
jgi:hypothetical protein